jgi:hypothetical protein
MFSPRYLQESSSNHGCLMNANNCNRLLANVSHFYKQMLRCLLLNTVLEKREAMHSALNHYKRNYVSTYADRSELIHMNLHGDRLLIVEICFRKITIWSPFKEMLATTRPIDFWLSQLAGVEKQCTVTWCTRSQRSPQSPGSFSGELICTLLNEFCWRVDYSTRTMKFSMFLYSLLIQNTWTDQSGSVEDQSRRET